VNKGTSVAGYRERVIRRWLTIAGASAAIMVVAACGSSSSTTAKTSGAASTSTSVAAKPGSAGAISSVDPKLGAVLGKCGVTISSCTVYSPGVMSSLKGKTIGVMDEVQVPGTERWSDPVMKFLKEAGAKVLYTNLNGVIANAPAALQTWLTDKVDAILELGIPLGGFSSFLHEAAAQKVPVIGFGAGTNAGTTVSVNLDAYQEGEALANYEVKTLPKGGTVLMLTYATIPTFLSRVAGQMAVFAKHPQFHVVQEPVSTISAEAASQTVNAYLSSHSNVAAINGLFGEAGVAAWQVAKQLHSKAIIAGMDGDADEFDAMRADGSLYRLTISAPEEAGATLSVMTAAAMLGGHAPAAYDMEVSSSSITQAHLPPPGGVDQSVRTVWKVVPSS
jgi:ABC-type sugar transport system substrate-binding protein